MKTKITEWYLVLLFLFLAEEMLKSGFQLYYKLSYPELRYPYSFASIMPFALLQLTIVAMLLIRHRLSIYFIQFYLVIQIYENYLMICADNIWISDTFINHTKTVLIARSIVFVVATILFATSWKNIKSTVVSTSN